MANARSRCQFPPACRVGLAKEMNRMFVRALGVALTVAVMGTGCAVQSSDTEMAKESAASTSSAFSTSPYQYALSYRGGSGGDARSLNCGPGNVVVGFYGRAANYVDQMGLICAGLNANGTLGPAFTIG